MRTLSKSDFKLARSCATKLYYREMGYPDNRAENAYLAMLAEGGYMVEQLAKLMHPEGITLEYGADAVADARATAELLQRDTVTLFEATLLSGNKLARVDILRKTGNRFELIEVKSKSFDGDDLRDGAGGPLRHKRAIRGHHAIIADWQPYLEDVTYQVHLLQELYPAADIRPRLLVVDKSRTTSIEGYPAMFTIRRNVRINGRVRDLDVQFTGDRAAIDPGEFLRLIEVDSEVEELLPTVAAESVRLAALLDDGTSQPVRQAPSLNWNCRDCEFRVAGGGSADGFRECWSDLAAVQPSILDLYKFGVNQWSGSRLADVMIAAREVSLNAVDPSRLVKKDGGEPQSKTRQLIQIEYTGKRAPWFGPRLRPELDALKWPLHFIDFETSQLAIPYHRNMRPYGRVAFQWSCHAMTAPDHEPRHQGWLNDVALWPNAEFVATLRQAIGDHGTVLMWHHYEADVLRTIRDELTVFGSADAATIAWLDALVGDRRDPDRPGRMFDMNRLCLEQFFHPAMKGSTSIKKVLDAVWRDDDMVRQNQARWEGDTALSADRGPYEQLPPIVIGGTPLSVADGTAAMRAYQAMMYGAERHDAGERAGLRDALDRYCRLDTLAMVLIWDYWRRHTGPRNV